MVQKRNKKQIGQVCGFFFVYLLFFYAKDVLPVFLIKMVI